MRYFKELEGNLITLALYGAFDVIGHGCNAFCTMASGIAPQMVKAFDTDRFDMELKLKGDINKLGQIDFQERFATAGEFSEDRWGGYKPVVVVNCYTQYHYGSKYGIPVDYDAIRLCMRKINHTFKGKHIGLPLLGCGLAGGDFSVVKKIFQEELKDMDVTIVHFDNKHLK